MRTHLLLSTAVLAAASLACSVFVGGPKLPDPPISGSPETLNTLEQDIQEALANSLTDGTLQLSITQEQMTAYLASRFAAQAEPLLTDPQVEFGDQQIKIYGRARSGIFEANVSMTAKFEIDADGRPDIRISGAEVGPMPVPQAFNDALASAVDEALTGYVGPVAIGFRLESIDISAGVMKVKGRLR
ncbi:MAG TPA: LmeA family phospholipid-binding protein [Anaerolineales bacterium]